ncbi:MAG TPA: hypothetical protein VEI47_00565 [Gemmatimonadales bacterium]|jgi:hypothetical protein|nr:hypothetical protein [Gemmatimonadales bacterium]
MTQGPGGLDPNYVFNELMPLLATVTVMGTAALCLRWLFRTPVGEAIAQRIREGRRRGRPGAIDDATRAELEERMAELQEQVGELAERLDFTERLLAAQRQRQVEPGLQ